MIEKLLVLSTAHLTPIACNGYLPGFIHAYPKADYGWFVYVPAMLDEDTPDSLADCLDFAHGHKIEWVMFDRDAPKVRGLPIYDWAGLDA